MLVRTPECPLLGASRGKHSPARRQPRMGIRLTFDYKRYGGARRQVLDARRRNARAGRVSEDESRSRESLMRSPDCAAQTPWLEASSLRSGATQGVSTRAEALARHDVLLFFTSHFVLLSLAFHFALHTSNFTLHFGSALATVLPAKSFTSSPRKYFSFAAFIIGMASNGLE